ncbi:hypothetical protein BDK51DRAFT_33153 [Blyttiomyces helicus]|uniref:Uncharacterized protein n=1 Tax=Blyttiomyces helicus TaxID=388810 RepID=A0A4P9WI68_9FUNG|nr:hypothetical protein BDK51DRAFT_33153 [Blyttiomyces helicus]|eukprot:RKO92559.1 hypothetical protein BDK51DRAFT_33153 [Blyttiomyces helicus]
MSEEKIMAILFHGENVALQSGNSSAWGFSVQNSMSTIWVPSQWFCSIGGWWVGVNDRLSEDGTKQDKDRGKIARTCATVSIEIRLWFVTNSHLVENYQRADRLHWVSVHSSITSEKSANLSLEGRLPGFEVETPIMGGLRGEGESYCPEPNAEWACSPSHTHALGWRSMGAP